MRFSTLKTTSPARIITLTLVGRIKTDLLGGIAGIELFFRRSWLIRTSNEGECIEGCQQFSRSRSFARLRRGRGAEQSLVRKV